MADRRTFGKAQSTRAASGRSRQSSRRPSQGQKTTSRNSESRAAARKVRGASHASVDIPTRSQAQTKRRTATTMGSGFRRNRSVSHVSSLGAEAARSGQMPATFGSVGKWVSSNRLIAAIIAIVLLIALVVVFDTFANMGKAYGNVSINGMNVSGMTAEDMHAALDENFGSKLASSQVTVYASEEARTESAQAHEGDQNQATAEQISAEDAKAKATSWTVDGATLSAHLDYDKAIEEALSAGRAGGPFDRLAVALGGASIDLNVEFDSGALDAFATDIDSAMGDARKDAMVVIEDGKASPVEGHDGMMVDRKWLAGKLSDVMLGKEGATYVIAEVGQAPSRTTIEQAEFVSDAVNRALRTGVSFTYESGNWTADATELGNWSRVEVVEGANGYDLQPSIDSAVATSALVKHLSASTASAASDSVAVDFESDNGQVMVKTSGAGEIPEVVPAIEQVNEAL